MPIDHTIPMQFRMPRVAGPMDMAGKATTLKNMMTQGELLDTQLSGAKFANKSAKQKWQLEQTNKLLLSAQSAGSPESLNIVKQKILELASDEAELANAQKLIDSLDQPGGLDFAIMSTSDVDKLLEYGNNARFDDFVADMRQQAAPGQTAQTAQTPQTSQGAQSFSGGPIVSQDPVVKQMEAVASAPLAPHEQELLGEQDTTAPTPGFPGGPEIAAASTSKPPMELDRVSGLIMKELAQLETERQMTIDFISKNRGRDNKRAYESLKSVDARTDKLHDQLITHSKDKVKIQKGMDVGNGYVQDMMSTDNGVTWQPFPGGKPYLRSATLPNQKITVEGEKQFQKNWLSETWNPTMEEGRRAEKALAQLQLFRNLPLEEITGFGSNVKAIGAAVLGALGVENAEQYASTAQMFTAIAMTRALEIFATQKGPQTEGDARRIVATGQQLSGTPEYNLFVTDFATATARKAAARAAFYRDNYRESMSSEELLGIERRWLETEQGNSSIWQMPEMDRWRKMSPQPSQGGQTYNGQQIYHNPNTGERIYFDRGMGKWTPVPQQ